MDRDPLCLTPLRARATRQRACCLWLSLFNQPPEIHWYTIFWMLETRENILTGYRATLSALRTRWKENLRCFLYRGPIAKSTLVCWEPWTHKSLSPAQIGLQTYCLRWQYWYSAAVVFMFWPDHSFCLWSFVVLRAQEWLQFLSIFQSWLVREVRIASEDKGAFRGGPPTGSKFFWYHLQTINSYFHVRTG